MGKSALESHEKGKKHMVKFKSRNTNASLFNFNIEKINFVENKNSNIQIPAAPLITNNENSTSQSKTIEKYLLSDKVTKAEVLCCIHGVMRHSSLRDIETTVSISQVVFYDSKIAKQMRLGKDKASYIMNYSISKYFQKELETKLKQCEAIVVGFDECLNSVSQRNQMDISIRFWDDQCDKVTTRYWTSAFLGHLTANDLLQAFIDCIPNDLRCKIIQISMDGPNVNWKFLMICRRSFQKILID